MEEIKSIIGKWRDIEGQDRGFIEAHFEEVFAKFKELREYIATYAYSIPTYLLQNYQQHLDQTNEQINKEKEQALPKKKFTFARK
jgi:hypothetical protein